MSMLHKPSAPLIH